MPRGPQYTEEELLDELRRLARIKGHAPRKRDMTNDGKHSHRTYILRFGSWSESVEAAGFTPFEKGDYAERPDACPLCDEEKTGLDFHHWRYGEDEQGCYLCRECHDAVHEGKAKKSNVNWLVHCVEKTVHHHLNKQSDVDGVDEILERYNLPNVRPLVERVVEDHSST